MRIEIIAYQERWPVEFRSVGALIRSPLGPLADRIDHIGSTSVPGLASKDVVDIQVGVHSIVPPEPLIRAFEAAGFLHRPNMTRDHLPPGATGPEEDWHKLGFGVPPGVRRCNIHVRVVGRANWRYAILFRDFLRSNAMAAGAYERAKLALARLHPDDIDAYLDVKDPFCDAVMAGAEIWVAATGWQPSPSDA